MLRQGLFINEAGYEYTVYEQLVDNYSRLDFCAQGASFHTDLSAIAFSIVKQKGTFIYGDRNIYRAYQDLLDTAKQIRTAEETSHEWKLGRYYTSIKRAQTSINFLEETVQCNGKPDSYMIQLGNRMYSVWNISDYSTGKYLPLNYSQYEELTLEGTSTVVTGAPFYSVGVLRARYDLSHLDTKDYVVADTIEVARARLHAWEAANYSLKGVDTETTGTDVNLFGSDEMVGIILAEDEETSTYYPFAHTLFPNLQEDFLQNELMPAIKREEKRLVSHNKKFERKVFLRLGWSIHIAKDTMPLSFMVNPVIERGAHALKELMFKLTNQKFLELDDIFVSSKYINFSLLPKEIVRLYACPDATSVITLYKHLWEELPVYSRPITEVEFDLADVKADQEYYGLRVDVQKFMSNLENCDYVLDTLLRAFRALTRVDGNINSTEVLSRLIFGTMHCPVLVRTKTGKPSTGAASIKKLARLKKEGERHGEVQGDLVDLHGRVIVKASDLNNAKYPALVILEKYRVYNKLRTAFYSRFERTKKSGRIFFWVNQNGAASGRQSSPMHQLPSELKDIILPDTEEHSMWDPDYSQIELRMIAFLAGESELIELCKDPENDIHRAISSLISHKEMWQISAEERKKGKSRNFGVVYMISAHGLAAQVSGAGYSSKDVEGAQRSLDEFYMRFKRIKKYVAMNAVKVQSQGYITTYFGRNRYFKEIFDPDITSRRRSSLIRQANNLPVQGTAADYMKLAETNYDRYIRNKGWDTILSSGFPRVRVGLSIHDEVLLMADKSVPYEEILLMIRECMEMPVEGAPPFFCAPALVQSWAQHDDDSVAMPVLLRDQLIAAYQQSGVSRLNDSTYMSTLNHYREQVLHTYMHGLIKSYGPSPAKVATHVRHPSLTHELLACYPPPRDSDFSQEEAVVYATEKYMQGDQTPQNNNIVSSVDALADVMDIQVLANFDANGEVVYESEEDSVVEDSVGVYEDEGYISSLTATEKLYVWELLDTLCIDISDMPEEKANLIIRRVWESRETNGFFRVMFLRNSNLLDAKFSVEDLDKEALTIYIKEVCGHEHRMVTG